MSERTSVETNTHCDTLADPAPHGRDGVVQVLVGGEDLDAIESLVIDRVDPENGIVGVVNHPVGAAVDVIEACCPLSETWRASERATEWASST